MINERHFAHNKGPFIWEINGQRVGQLDGDGWALVRDLPTVRDYGAVGDGSTDDTAAFQSVLSAHAGKQIIVPVGTYRITSALTVQAGTHLMGQSKSGSQIKLDAAVTLIDLGDAAKLSNLYLNGNGQAGKGVNLAAGTSQQVIDSCEIINFDAACINFADTTAGSGISVVNSLIYRYNGAAGDGKYSVIVPDSAQASAYPRYFAGIQTGAKPTFSFGGCNGFYVFGSFLGDMLFSDNSRSVLMNGCRYGTTTTPLTIKGGQHTIAGCDIYPAITLASGCGGSVIGPNSHNTPTVTDSSGVSTNLVYQYDQSYTPTFSASGGGASLGNGSISGTYSRQGNIVTVCIQMTAGSTTNFGSGNLEFSIPTHYPTAFGFPQMSIGHCRGFDVSPGTAYWSRASLTNGTSVITLLDFAAATPATWANGDIFQGVFRYQV